jgi:hypothetical protein
LKSYRKYDIIQGVDFFKVRGIGFKEEARERQERKD